TSFSAITPDEPVLSTEEPDNSLNQFEDLFKSNEEFSSIDDDSFSIEDIDYVEASPPDSELVSSEVIEIVIPKVVGIEASNDNPIPFYDPIISGTPPNLTPSGESDFFLETKSSSTSLNSLLEETNNFDNSLPEFTTFSNDPFDAKYESNSSDDQSYKFAGELALLKSSPPGIDETDYDFEDDIRLIEKLLYDNSSPHYPMPSGIEDKDYDSERDILILKDLPSNNTLSFAEKESFHFDIPLFSRPPVKPPDGDSGILNIKMM
nr:hypothetical protein [Tanacetum cinerariifolium]